MLTTSLLVLLIPLILYLFGRYYLWPRRYLTYTWLFTLRNHRSLGKPYRANIILDRKGYSLGFDKKLKSALWVSYIITERSVNVDYERSSTFYADPDIPAQYQVEPEDYRGTGYDKGHLAPSATIDFSRSSNDETFAMSNIVPQHPNLNRQAWSRLEDMIRRWAESKGKLAIVTGPIYNQRPPRRNGVPIPKAFYKVIYSFEHKTSIGFIFPNQPVPRQHVWHYVQTVREVEKATGYRFFSKLGRKGSRIKNKLNVRWWQKGL